MNTYPAFSSNPCSPLNRARLRLWEAKALLALANKGIINKSRAMAELNRARSALGRIIKPVQQYSIDVELTIAGIPCGAHVTHYSPAKPMVITGTGYGDCEPPEPEQVEFFIVDRRGYPADWLAVKEPWSVIEAKVLEGMR